MLQNAPFKFFFGEACPRTPQAKARGVRGHEHLVCNTLVLGYATRRKPPPQKKNSWPPLANPAYAHELLLRNLFENPPWQTVDCV